MCRGGAMYRLIHLFFVRTKCRLLLIYIEPYKWFHQIAGWHQSFRQGTFLKRLYLRLRVHFFPTRSSYGKPSSESITAETVPRQKHQRAGVFSSSRKVSIYTGYLDRVLANQLGRHKTGAPIPLFNQWLTYKGFSIANESQTADIVIVATDSKLYQPDIRHVKKMILCTEPTGSLLRKRTYKINGQPVLVSNPHINSVLTNNYFFYHCVRDHYRGDQLLPPVRFDDIRHKWERAKKVLCLKTLHRFNHPNSLDYLRNRLVVCGYVLGVTDVRGRGWPSHMMMPKPYTEVQGQYATKMEWLDRYYLYSLCLENSDLPYYATEKPWEALFSKVLPIYYGNDTFYQTFPEDCVIDYQNFQDEYDLYQFILDMPVGEYLDRLNAGVEFINRTDRHEASFRQWQKEAHQRICDNLIELSEM